MFQSYFASAIPARSTADKRIFRGMAPITAAVFVLLSLPTHAIAEETADRELPRVDVIGDSLNVMKLPGSATVIESATLEESRVFNVNEALRKVPGVHVRDEEGVGLRPNIGIRGMNPTRSTKTLLLEDGLPLSFAPYGDNASYYHPPIDRYESIEVSKGSQVIRFGPQTAGGLINYVTPEPQKQFGGTVGLAGGTRGYLNGHVMVTGNGAIADIYHKESDGARNNMHSRLDDVNFKWARHLNEEHKLVLRATHFQEYSQLTYSGLTQNEYLNFGARYNPFKNDFFDANRTGLSATHEWKINGDSKLVTSLYGSYFDRDWWRQASDTGTSLNCQSVQRTTGLIQLGDSDLNSCKMQGRLRQYTTVGIDSRMLTRHQALGVQHDLEYGIKFQYENQRRRQTNYTTYSNYVLDSGSTTGENQRRQTEAMSAFVSNRMQLTERLAVTPIVRVENIRNKRTFYAADDNGSNADSGTFVRSFTEFIPGIGLTYQLDDRNTLYGGVHRGFSPPRVEDSFTQLGASIDLNAEKSTNAELGLRSKPNEQITLDVAVFRNDFSNLIAVGSIAGGTTSYSEGKALMQGMEAAGQWDKMTSQLAGNLFTRLSLTYLSTAEQSSTFYSPSQVNGGSAVTGSGAGRRLPYAPEYLLTLTLGYRAPERWNTRMEYVYVGEQYTDFSNTVSATAGSNGQTGVIDASGIWNVVANYTLGNATFFISGKNLADKTYIVDRTRGIQVGMPRTVQLGMKYAF
jgi:Fe(3+) dicitrate transport protein